MVVVEEKKIAEAKIEREGVATPRPPTPKPPTPTPVPTKEMKAFVTEHEKIKSIIERHGGCASLTTLMTEGNVDEKRLTLHRTMFEDDDYVGLVVKDALCSRNAVKKLYKKLLESE